MATRQRRRGAAGASGPVAAGGSPFGARSREVAQRQVPTSGSHSLRGVRRGGLRDTQGSCGRVGAGGGARRSAPRMRPPPGGTSTLASEVLASQARGPARRVLTCLSRRRLRFAAVRWAGGRGSRPRSRLGVLAPDALAPVPLWRVGGGTVLRALGFLSLAVGNWWVGGAPRPCFRASRPHGRRCAGYQQGVRVSPEQRGDAVRVLLLAPSVAALGSAAARAASRRPRSWVVRISFADLLGFQLLVPPNAAPSEAEQGDNGESRGEPLTGAPRARPTQVGMAHSATGSRTHPPGGVGPASRVEAPPPPRGAPGVRTGLAGRRRSSRPRRTRSAGSTSSWSPAPRPPGPRRSCRHSRWGARAFGLRASR